MHCFPRAFPFSRALQCKNIKPITSTYTPKCHRNAGGYSKSSGVYCFPTFKILVLDRERESKREREREEREKLRKRGRIERNNNSAAITLTLTDTHERSHSSREPRHRRALPPPLSLNVSEAVSGIAKPPGTSLRSSGPPGCLS